MLTIYKKTPMSDSGKKNLKDLLTIKLQGFADRVGFHLNSVGLMLGGKSSEYRLSSETSKEVRRAYLEEIKEKGAQASRMLEENEY